MALIGSALANARAGKHIITTCFEHAAVYEPLLYLEKWVMKSLTFPWIQWGM